MNMKRLVLLSLILVAVLATSLFFSSRSLVINSVEYNALADVNGDGIINIMDIVLVAKCFGAKGTPTKGCINEPAWDSGWVECRKEYNTFYHWLNTTDLIVYITGRNSTYGGIHQIEYGGEFALVSETGVWWQDLTSTSITVHRRVDDENWNQVRVMIWKILEVP